MCTKNEKVCPTCYSKQNLKCETQKCYSLNDSKQRRMVLSCSKKKLSALLREITSKYNGDFYCLRCLHSFQTKNKLKLHRKVCKNKYFCNAVMPSENTKILEFNQYWKSDKTSFIANADLESLTEKNDGWKNPENHLQQK